MGRYEWNAINRPTQFLFQSGVKSKYEGEDSSRRKVRNMDKLHKLQKLGMGGFKI